MFQCNAFQLDAFQNDCRIDGFQCDAFQLDAFQNDCGGGGGGPALLREPWGRRVGIPAGRAFTYAGRVTVYVGGEGRTVFEAPSPEVHSFRGRARVRLGGEASYCLIDPNAEIRRLDDELLLML